MLAAQGLAAGGEDEGGEDEGGDADEGGESEGEEGGPMSWIECDKCGQWRELAGNDAGYDMMRWTCAHNPDPRYNCCSVPEDPRAWEDAEEEEGEAGEEGEEGEEGEVEGAVGGEVEVQVDAWVESSDEDEEEARGGEAKGGEVRPPLAAASKFEEGTVRAGADGRSLWCCEMEWAKNSSRKWVWVLESASGAPPSRRAPVEYPRAAGSGRPPRAALRPTPLAAAPGPAAPLPPLHPRAAAGSGRPSRPASRAASDTSEVQDGAAREAPPAPRRHERGAGGASGREGWVAALDSRLDCLRGAPRAGWPNPHPNPNPNPHPHPDPNPNQVRHERAGTGWPPRAGRPPPPGWARWTGSSRTAASP